MKPCSFSDVFPCFLGHPDLSSERQSNMLKSIWKPESEIQKALEGVESIALISCAVCANLSGTGGHQGLKTMKGLAEKWGKRVVTSQCVVACCSAEIMAQANRVYLAPIAEKCDAVVMLSCAGGVKSAYLAKPDMAVVAALDSVGSAVITQQDDPIVQSLCVGCGQCVLSYTGGICPMSKCPSKRRYSPCSRQPEAGNTCTVNPAQKCVWKEIEKRGDMEALAALGHMHKGEQSERIPSHVNAAFPKFGRAFTGWAMARSGRLAWIFRSIM